MAIEWENNNNAYIGTWSTISDTVAAECVALAGLDFVIMDLEHGSYSYQEIGHLIKVYRSRAVTAIVRTSSKDESHILRVLELDPDILLVPHVESVEAAKNVVARTKYPPQGERGLSPYTAVHNYHHKNIRVTQQDLNSRLKIGILVEGENGLNSLPDISRVDGIDLIYLGLFDLANSLGIEPIIDSPEMQQAISKSANIIRGAGKMAGTMSTSATMSKDLISQGFNFVATLHDGHLLMEACQTLVDQIRSE